MKRDLALEGARGRGGGERYGLRESEKVGLEWEGSGRRRGRVRYR